MYDNVIIFGFFVGLVSFSWVVDDFFVSHFIEANIVHHIANIARNKNEVANIATTIEKVLSVQIF